MPLTELRIDGLRTIERAQLALDGLTVLIGENGSGKSSIIEACEILRRATGEHFLDELYTIHGGMGALLRQGAPSLKLGVTITVKPGEGGSEKIRDGLSRECESFHYDLALMLTGSFATIHETLRAVVSPEHLTVLRRSAPAMSQRRPSAMLPCVRVQGDVA